MKLTGYDGSAAWKDHAAKLAIDVRRTGSSGRAVLTIRFPGGGTLTDRIDLADAKARAAFGDRACTDRPDVDRADLLERLEAIAAEPESRPDDRSGPRSQADLIVDMVTTAPGVELFHTADGASFATIRVGTHRETWKVKSDGFRDWVAQNFYTVFGKAPGAQAMQDATCTLAGKARYAGPDRPVSLRIAEADGAVFLDLCDADWRAVRIGAEGWHVVPGDEVPARFIRRRGMLALPVPVSGGSIDELRSLVNLPDDDLWTLGIGWLVAAFRPRGPYIILLVSGEQGSAKSFLCKLFRALVDPSKTPVRRPPRDERNVYIAAGNSWAPCFDNLSGIRADLADCICNLATGGGFADRELYADDEEAIFDVCRPVMLNGIDDLGSRPDLLDRSICLHLPTIDEERRRTEAALFAELEPIRGSILGALLTAVSAAMRNQNTITLPRLPRMADAALWVTGAEEALGWDRGRFVAAFERNRSGANAMAVESSPIGPAIVALVTRGAFTGTVSELLAELNQTRPNPVPLDWPRNAKGLANALRRLAPNLRAQGIDVVTPERPSGRDKRRVLRLEKTCAARSASSAHTAEDVSDRADAAAVDHADHADHAQPPFSNPSDGDNRGDAPDWDAVKALATPRSKLDLEGGR